MNTRRLALAHITWLALCLGLLQGCASLQPSFDKPTVKLVSLALLPSNGLEQRFGIGLQISNPNAMAINLVGMSYALSLQGHEVLDGVANDIPELPAYGESRVDLEATVNLVQSLQLLQTLISQRHQSLEYELVAKLVL